MRVKIYYNHYDVRAIPGSFAVADQLFVIGGMKIQRRVALKRDILMTDAIDQRNQLAQAVGPVQIPMPNLVLLRIEILLATCAERTALQQLKRRSVNAVVRAQ